MERPCENTRKKLVVALAVMYLRKGFLYGDPVKRAKDLVLYDVAQEILPEEVVDEVIDAIEKVYNALDDLAKNKEKPTYAAAVKRVLERL